MSTASRTAVIAGATGLVGSHLLERLLADPRYGKVVAVVRRPTGCSHPKLKERIADFDDLEEELAGLSAQDWFCVLGTTIKQAGTREAFRRVDYDYPLTLGRIAASSGAERFLAVTAMGASAGSAIFYNRVKGELERDLADVGLPSLLLFRPSLLLGNRGAFRFGEKLAAVVMTALRPLMAGGLRKYRAIEADAVAGAMLAAAHQPAPEAVQVIDNDRIADLAALPPY